MILIPKYRDVIADAKAPRVGLRGWYKLEAVGLDGRKRLLAEFPNLITTNGANMLGTGAGWDSYCSVGSGNNPPALTDTALQTLVATTSSTNFVNHTNTTSSPPYFGNYTVQYAFAIGAAAGNLSEVGIGSASNGTSLFSRALILDGGGNPTTITVLSSEALYVTYSINQYVPLTDVTGSVVIAGVTYNYTIRAANATSSAWSIYGGDAGGIELYTSYNGSIGAITSSPSGTSGSYSSIANNSYSTGSFTLSGAVTIGLTQSNLSGGISACYVVFGTSRGCRGQYQIGLSPAIPKDSSHVLTLNFSTSWTINSP
jgi:hypothetical protein